MAEERFRFDLWAARLGVFAPGTLSVSQRLRKNAVAAQALVQLLKALSFNLRARKRSPAKVRLEMS